MFDDFYGFTGRPFQLTPDPRFWFDTATHRKAMAYLGYGLAQGEGFIVITGDIGAGKTTLVGHLMERIDRERLNVVKLVSTQIAAEDLLRLVADGMGVAGAGLGKGELLGAIERGLHAAARAGKRTLLIVDEAQALPTESLEELRMLSNFQAGGHPLLQIFLLGQPEFRERLHGSDRLEQLRQRVIAVHHLDPMGADEVAPYMAHRLRLVGWDGRPTFTSDAYAALYGASDGLPRRLNQLVGRVLLAGAVERLDVIDGGTVDRVVADIAGDARPAAAAPELRRDEPELAFTAAPVAAPLPEPVIATDPAPEPSAPVLVPTPVEFEPEVAVAPRPAPTTETIVTEPVQAGAVTSPSLLAAEEEQAALRQAQGDRVEERAAVPDDHAAARLAALEARVEEQDAALRRMLTLLVDWVEGDGRSDRTQRAA